MLKARQPLDYPELEALYPKCGGKFRLTVLLQRRVNDLVKGAPKLVPGDFGKDFIRIAIEEIKADKISLAEDDETVVAAE